MFAPGAPLAPMPGMVQPSGPRGWQFPVGYNIYSQPRSTEATSFDTLRNLAMLYDGIQLCEQVWLDTVAKLNLVIKPRDEIIAEQGKSAATQKYSDKIRAYTDFFAMPDQGNGYDLKSWLRAAVRDQLQLDAVAVYVRRNRGGGVYSLELVDGSTVKPLIDPRGRRPAPPFPAYQQFIYGVPAGQYTSDEMLYLRETVRTESVYGLSRVERIILRINQALRKENKDLARFTDGNVPPGIMSPPDDGSQWTPEQLMVYQEMWDALLAGNDQARSRIKVIQPGSTLTPLQEPDIFVDFDRFLLNVTAACYSMTMADLGFTENVNKSSGESQQNVFYRRAVQPLMDRYATLFTLILRYYFGEQDLVVSWSGFEEAEDFNANAASYVSLVATGIVSPTTAAHQLNIPWSGPEIPVFVMSKDGPIFLEDMADPGMRKAANDAKLAGLQFTQQNPGGPPKPTNDDNASDNVVVDKTGQATKGNTKQRGKGKATPPGSGAKSSDDDQEDDQRLALPEITRSHTGMMLAFMLDPETAQQLAPPDGEPAEELHVTLAYLGDMDDDTEPGKRHPVTSLSELRTGLAGFARQMQPLQGNVGGLVRFAPSPSSDEASPVIALVNAPGLQEFRRNLVGFLESAGFHVANNFDYTPHITLAYIDPDAPMPIDDVPALPLSFNEICLVIGDEHYTFPIGREERSEQAAIIRRMARSWRAPSATQRDLEARLASAIKAFITQAKLSRDGVTAPDADARNALYEQLSEILEAAVHEGRRIATNEEQRGLISATKNLAGRAIQTINSIVDQLVEKATALIEDLFASDEIDDPDAILDEVQSQLDEWSVDYSDLVASTEIQDAVESSVLDTLQERGVSLVAWDADASACPLCQDNADAGPWPIGTPFPSGATAPPGHPRCRCTLSPA